MNLNEIHQFLTNVLREGAGTVALTVIALVVGILVHRWFARREEARLAAELELRNKQLSDSRAELAEAQRALGVVREKVNEEQARVGRRNATIAKLSQLVERAKTFLAALRRERDEARGKAAHLSGEGQKLVETAGELSRVREELDRVKRDSQGADEAIDSLRKMEQDISELIAGSGRVWERPTVPGVGPFRPLRERGCPVIAVLNLKGGVGKTTLTVNLAARMATARERVLMIDLDHQRTLGAITLHPDTRIQLHNDGQTLQHFLQGPDRSGARLASFARPILNADSVSLVINTNPDVLVRDQTSLEQVEEQLYARWLLGRSDGDPRVYLRDAVQADAIARHYRYVFLDCPPRLSPSCVNAIVAADFVLIPVYLDKTSTTSLIYLIRELRRLRNHPLFAHLRVLGIVANAATGGTISNLYRPLWNSLDVECRGAWGTTVHRFGAAIRPCSDLGKAANVLPEKGYDPPSLGGLAVADDFRKLAEEIHTRIEHESQ